MVLDSNSAIDASFLERTDTVPRQVEAILVRQSTVAYTTTISGYSLLSGTSASNTAFFFVSMKPRGEEGQGGGGMRGHASPQREEIPGAIVFAFGPPPIPGLATGAGFSFMLQDVSGGSPDYLAESVTVRAPRAPGAFLGDAIETRWIGASRSSMLRALPPRRDRARGSSDPEVRQPTREFAMPPRETLWPVLDYAHCKDALDALHMETQVVGKVKLALTRVAPEWQNVPLSVNARGLTTGLLQAGDAGIEISFDLVAHRLDIFTTEGRREGFELTRRPLRTFTAELMGALKRLKVDVTINPMTVEVPNPVRCDEYEGYDGYNPDVANRLFRILSQTATVFEDFRAGFWGKQGPVSFFWGTFDLAVARFNLAPVPPGPGMDQIYRVAMDSQLAEVGFWSGSEKYPRPAYYSFSYPKPLGIEKASVRPSAAAWNEAMGEFLLDYEAVRAAQDPRAALHEFLNSTYEAGATLSGWDRELLNRRPPK